jgi:diguanylate cyclase (GGDEF)-like protein/putative nucleotidyltransferase with HDIG domain
MSIEMDSIARRVRLYQVFILLLGAGIAARQMVVWQHDSLVLFLFFLACSVACAWLRIGLPTTEGVVSIGFVFVLAGLVRLDLIQVSILAVASTVVSFLRHARRPFDWWNLAFLSAVSLLGVQAGYAVYHRVAEITGADYGVVSGLPLAAATMFLVTAFPQATTEALSQKVPLRRVRQEKYLWTMPYYLAGAAIAIIVLVLSRFPWWESVLIVVPLLFLVYRAFSLQLEKLAREKQHAEELNSLQLGMIEALALAVESRSMGTRDHLHRVMVYVMGVGREMGLSDDELKALRVAAVLHDIGKLAVPDHIISKPGRLTPEEYDRLKIHTIVGAEIVERAGFPYPVAPIVRAHHERWDGTGYPQNLKGEEIPIGARILAAVDCLDALNSDRHYRRALPLDQALEIVVSESGRSYDPRVVSVLQRMYKDLENEARATQNQWKDAPDLSATVRQAEEAVGLTAEPAPAPSTFLDSIAEARREEQVLFELNQIIGNSLNLRETITNLAQRLTGIVPHDTLVLYVLRGEKLEAEQVAGELISVFQGLKMPLGQGLSGWVADVRKPVINGNPAVEPVSPVMVKRLDKLKSALALPLDSGRGLAGVLTLFSAQPDAFTRDHLRLLSSIAPRLASFVENALRFHQAENLASHDFLTGLPNAGSLSAHLHSEISRCQRNSSSLVVLLCDLDGFKQVNDRFGHLNGNKVLQAVARGLKEHCREYDFVARMGGDEFVIVLPGLSPEAVQARESRFAEIVVQIGRNLFGEEVISLSIGEAYFPTDGSTPEELLARADARMYRHKSVQKANRLMTAHDWYEPGETARSAQAGSGSPR